MALDGIAAVQARIAQIQRSDVRRRRHRGAARRPRQPARPQSPMFASLLASAMGSGTGDLDSIRARAVSGGSGGDVAADRS